MSNLKTHATWLEMRARTISHNALCSLCECSKCAIMFNYMNHEHQGGLMLLLPAAMPGSNIPSPTVLQISQLTVHLLWWHAGPVLPSVERTIGTGYQLQFKVRPPCFHRIVYTVLRNEVAAELKKNNNNLLKKERYDCSRFRSEQKPLFQKKWENSFLPFNPILDN